MDPKSIFVTEILRFGLGFGHFLNSTKEFILIKEDSFVSIFYNLLCLEVKPLIENMSPRFYLAGDSGYPISKTLITPYSTEEAESKN